MLAGTVVLAFWHAPAGHPRQGRAPTLGGEAGKWGQEGARLREVSKPAARLDLEKKRKGVNLLKNNIFWAITACQACAKYFKNIISFTLH